MQGSQGEDKNAFIAPLILVFEEANAVARCNLIEYLTSIASPRLEFFSGTLDTVIMELGKALTGR